MISHFIQAASTIGKFLRLIARTCLLAVCGWGALHAQQDLEGSVPVNWTASAGTLSISPFHYKLGTESLRWDWNGGSAITVTNPNIPAADVTNFAKNTCDFWVWNGNAVPGGQLKIEFMNGATAQYWFEFNLDYTGWRRAVRSYRHDMSKKSNPSSTFTSVRITAPAAGTGSLFLDAVTWVGNRFERIRDAQNPGIAGDFSNTLYSASYAQLPTVPDDEPTATEIADLAILRSRWLAVAKGSSAPNSSSVTSAGISFDAMNIVEDSNGIRGAVVGQNTDDLESWPRTLARDYVWESGTAIDSRDKILQLARHLMDQGHGANSNELPTAPTGINYNYRNLPTTLILMAPAYDAATKQKTWEWLHWAYRNGDFWSTAWERNVDDIHLHAVQQLGAILFLISDKEAVRQLKGNKLYLDRFWQFSEGSEGGVKIDGTGFHHRSHYNNYMYAYSTMAAAVHQLRGTGFQINQTAYENLRLAFMTYMRMSADSTGNTYGYFGNSLCGRKPFETSTSFSQAAMQQLGELGGQFSTPVSTADPIVAKAYNRRFGVNHFSLFSTYGVEPSPDGFYQFNYSPLGIYRRANWVASIRAPQRYFWSAEIWTNSNVYGRYQAYGALEMLYNGMVSSRTPKDMNGNNVLIPDPNNANNTIPKLVTVRSGQSEDGWDWSQPPGTTTIAIPHDQLGMKEREDVRSQLNFSGALAFRGDGNGAQSQSGLYAANFQESKPGSIQGLSHNLSFVWRKSWFCFDSQIVCLGSDITNQNATHPTVTTLFQGVLPTRSTATILNGTSLTAFPHSETVSGAGAPWLLDSYDTGYLLQSNGNLKISRSNQVSARHTGNGATTTDDFAKAWIDHGINPDGEGYEYSVFPNTTSSAMTTAATAHASGVTKPYRVYQRDSKAHVVKWKASGQIGYAIFTSEELPAETQNAGLLMSVQRPCLVMTQLGTSGDAWVSVVDPDLNFTHPQAEYNLPDASMARTLDLTVHGVWSVDNPAVGTSIVASSVANTTTIRVTTQHGSAAHVRLMPPPVPAAISWVNLGTDWTDPANWGANWGGSPPEDDPDTDIATLGAAAVQPVLDGPYAIKGLSLDGGTILSGSGNLTLGSGGVIATGTNNAFALSNIALHASQTWDIGPGSLSVSSVIAGPAGAVLTKAGSGTLTLSGVNTYTGVTTVTSGTVTVQNDQSAANGGWSVVSSLTTGGLTATANCNSGSTVAAAIGKNIQVGRSANSGSYPNSTLNVAGTVSNAGTLNVQRAGTLNLDSGASWTQDGDMVVSGRGGASAALNINSGASMSYSGTNTFKINAAAVSSGKATLTIDGTGLFTTAAGFENLTSNTNSGYGRVALTNGGTLKLSAAMADLTTETQFTLGTGGGVIDNNGFNNNLSGIVTTGFGPLTTGITGTGSLTSTGSGTLTLSGLNTYSGDTTVSSGILTLDQVNNSNEASTVSIASGAMLNLAFSGTDTVDKLFINGVQKAAGDYTSAHPSGTISGAGTLRVTTGNIVQPPGYADWAAANAPGLNADMDHDNDGVQNGIEYFMGLSGSGFTANPIPDANRLVSWPMGSNYSGVYGINYAVQTSPDLVSWSDVPQSVVTIVAGSSVSHTITGPGAKFVRLAVRPD